MPYHAQGSHDITLKTTIGLIKKFESCLSSKKSKKIGRERPDNFLRDPTNTIRISKPQKLSIASNLKQSTVGTPDFHAQPLWAQS